MKQLTIIGGSNGIGAAFASLLKDKYDKTVIVDLVPPKESNVEYIKFDLYKQSPNEIREVLLNTNTLILTAGIGRVTQFQNLELEEIEKTIEIDFTCSIKILRIFFEVLLSKDDVYCLTMGSLAGEISSPLFSVYGACKAGLNKLIESLNIELEKYESSNRILNVMPISFKGSSFNGGVTNLSELKELANECLDALFNKKMNYIPNFDICSNILKRYNENKYEFGLSSYEYKIKNNRLQNKSLIKVGYLSGTFDLFHVGHLNLLRKAKEFCDYLIVGVHPDASHKGKKTFISFEERKKIVESISYVNKVVTSCKEDSDAWDLYHYDYLFVGSDYKGTERFLKYEEYFEDKNVKIIYFPYTDGTSSSQLRDALNKINEKK